MKKRLLIAAAVVVVAGMLIFVLGRGRNRQEIGAITLSGNVEVTETVCGFKVPGRIERLMAEEGQKIGKGETLAILDSAEINTQVLQAKAAYDEALARLQDLRSGPRPQETEQARALVLSAEAEFKKAARDSERAELLFENGAISAQQMDAARRAQEVAAAQKQKAGEALSLIREGARKDELRASASRVSQAEALKRTSEERLRDTVLSAPLSGVVLRKNREEGEVVPAGGAVYTIGDLEHPWIRVYVREDKLGMVKLGQETEIKTDTYPNKVYRGKVTFISSEAEFTPKNVQTQEERVKLVFGVKVSLQNVSDELKPGMPADVRIIVR